ncbi:MAG: cysteine hydrolase [Desulfomonile sp.]|nr:cysteine hydrolase [Desulfomonile sp.]
MNPLLLLIDIQADYFPGGAMELQGSPEASVNAKRILELFRRSERPVVHIQHVSTRPGATFLRSGTPGVEIHENVKPLADEIVITKHFPNSFRETPLLDQLKSAAADKLVICGMMTHMCVDSTVRAAFDHGFPNVLIADACATRSLVYDSVSVPAEQVHTAFIAALSPLFAKAMRTEDYIAAVDGGEW